MVEKGLGFFSFCLGFLWVSSALDDEIEMEICKHGGIFYVF